MFNENYILDFEFDEIQLLVQSVAPLEKIELSSFDVIRKKNFIKKTKILNKFKKI